MSNRKSSHNVRPVKVATLNCPSPEREDCKEMSDIIDSMDSMETKGSNHFEIPSAYSKLGVFSVTTKPRFTLECECTSPPTPHSSPKRQAYLHGKDYYRTLGPLSPEKKRN